MTNLATFTIKQNIELNSIICIQGYSSCFGNFDGLVTRYSKNGLGHCLRFTLKHTRVYYSFVLEQTMEDVKNGGYHKTVKINKKANFRSFREMCDVIKGIVNRETAQ